MNPVSCAGTRSDNFYEVRPEVNVPSSFSINEGSSGAFGGAFKGVPSAESYSGKAEWSDGVKPPLNFTFDTTGTDGVFRKIGSFQTTRAFDDNAEYGIEFKITDPDGLISKAASATVTVLNVAPMPAIAGPARGVRGQPRPFTVSADDPSSADEAAGFSFVIDWGDGTDPQTIPATPNNGAGVALGHIFTTVGTYTVQVTATDKDGGKKRRSLTQSRSSPLPLRMAS